MKAAAGTDLSTRLKQLEDGVGAGLVGDELRVVVIVVHDATASVLCSA